jgi:hypothetical protein
MRLSGALNHNNLKHHSIAAGREQRHTATQSKNMEKRKSQAEPGLDYAFSAAYRLVLRFLAAGTLHAIVVRMKQQ